ncbi:MAG: hypothetical protein QM680_00260 [Luteolibacter sp.]
MKAGSKNRSPKTKGFSLLELCMVVLVSACCLTAGVVWLMPPVSQKRKAATDAVIRMVETARSSALAGGKSVILAVADPDVLQGIDGYRLGVFVIQKMPGTSDEPILVSQVQRWSEISENIVFAKGEVNESPNLMDSEKREIRYGSEADPKQIQVRILEFNPDGGLAVPQGDGPVVMRVAERAKGNGSEAGAREDWVKIGRVNARAYRF